MNTSKTSYPKEVKEILRELDKIDWKRLLPYGELTISLSCGKIYEIDPHWKVKADLARSG